MKKYTIRVRRLLFEAYRRNEMAKTNPSENIKPLNQRWLGLGSKSAYLPVLKAGLMRFHDGELPPPRCMGWLCLTDAGVDRMRELEPEFKKVLDEMKAQGYEKTVYAQFMLAGGVTCR